MPDSDPDDELIKEIRRKVADAKNSTGPSEPVKTPDLRSPEDVKDYLDGLFVEYSYQCMSEKRPDGCHRLANYMENIQKDYKGATDLYKKNCDGYKYPRSCLTYAKNKSLGRGGPKDLLEACKYSFIACDLGMVEGCLNAGVCLSEGVGGLPINLMDAVPFLNKACDEGNSVGCMKLFNLYINEKSRKMDVGMGRDPVKAYEYARRACDLNDIMGCLNAARQCNIGDGIPKNQKLTNEYREKADVLKKDMDSMREQQKIQFGEQHK